METAEKKIVRQGYDALGTAYREHFSLLHRERYAAWLAEFSKQVPNGGRVVELGCADGFPSALELARTHHYVGVELSPVQASAAQRLVPSAVFIVADMTQIAFTDESLDGVLALYSIIHVPQEEQPQLFRSIYSWLRPGGIFMAVVGAENWTGIARDWIRPDTTMYWSHGSGDDYERLCREVGFKLLQQYFVPEGNLGHTFMMLKKPSDRATDSSRASPLSV